MPKWAQSGPPKYFPPNPILQRPARGREEAPAGGGMEAQVRGMSMGPPDAWVPWRRAAVGGVRKKPLNIRGQWRGPAAPPEPGAPSSDVSLHALLEALPIVRVLGSVGEAGGAGVLAHGVVGGAVQAGRGRLAVA